MCKCAEHWEWMLDKAKQVWRRINTNARQVDAPIQQQKVATTPRSLAEQQSTVQDVP